MTRTSAFLVAAAVVFVCLLPITAVGGTIIGQVTSDESGTPAIPGALITTEGEPAYSAVAGADGSYTITAPANTYHVLISAAGHTPQRASVAVTGGSTTVNIALRPVAAGTFPLSLPAPLESGEPPMAPAPPGDSFPISFTDMAGTPPAGSPKISAFNETVKPDESFTMTGADFTTRTGPDAGTDTIVWVWARTSSTGGTLRQARVWKVTSSTITATIPDDIPFGMYFVWAENSIGAGLPICLNKATSSWVGPLGNAVQAGNKKRVIGRNITYGHGLNASYVYIQPAAGGSFISCPTDSSNPYMVQFTVPVGTPNGTYNVFVHNGHGGVYGWSDPQTIVVQPDWVRDSYVTTIAPSGGDDTAAIQNAINTISARTNGGTIQLSSGTYEINAQLWIKSGVRIVGAGMNQTTLELRETVSSHDFVRLHGSNMALENLTLQAKLDSPVFPPYGIIEGPYPEYSWAEATDIKYANVRVTADFMCTLTQNNLGYARVEASGCEFYRMMGPGSTDGWAHGCNFYGGPYGNGNPYFETEAAINPGSLSIVENCHAETQNWPVNPNNGSLNYMDWYQQVYGSWNAIGYKVWAKRFALLGGGGFYSWSYKDYMANNTSKDVAVEDNRGEMILYHGSGAYWWGNVLSTSGSTVNLRTDGLVDGVPSSIPNYSSTPLPGGQPLTSAVDGYWAVIISGRGMGQQSQIASHTTSSVTISTPWRVAPDSTSKMVICHMCIENVIYNNDLNAFPVGYAQGANASRGIDIDGNGWRIVSEKNSSHRTNGARDIFAPSGGPSYWCDMRDETAENCHSWGYGVAYWDTNSAGQMLIGNGYRNCSVTILDSADSGGVHIMGEGSFAENMTVSAKRGYNLSGAYSTGLADGLTIYRNGHVTATDNATATTPSAPQPVYVSQTDGKQLLVNNSYSGAPLNYYLNTGLSPYNIPEPEYKAVKFRGYAGYPVHSQIIPVVDAGVAAMTWTVTPSDPWITATIQSNGTLAADSTLGRLVISVDTSGMPAGKTWGSVTIDTGSSTAKIGVCADLASGAPPTQSPVASFAATPNAGPAPVAVSFDASASYDPDGSIQGYYWDYGDGTYGTGVTSSHNYPSANTYTPTLTVTDNMGAASQAWTNVSVVPALTGITIAGSPVGSIGVSTPVTLTASATGGYLVQYRFLYKDSMGWHILRDYASSNTCVWTPAVSGYYELKVYVKNTGSTNVYDLSSGILSYPVGQLPINPRLWLKADAGVSVTAGGVSTWADQSGSGNDVTQSNSSYRPASVAGVINGRAVVRFTGPSQIMQALGQVVSGSVSFTTFTLGKFNSLPATNYQYFWWNGPDSISAGYGCYINTANNVRAGWGSNSSAPSSAPVTVGTLYEITTRFTATNGSGPNEMWVNGTSPGPRTKNGSNLSGGVFTVGNFGPSSGQGLNGDIAEILIYDRSLTDTEKGNVESYLNARWTPPSAVSIDRLKDVRVLGDGVIVSLSSAKVATNSSGSYSDGSVYISEADRTCGLKVTGAGAVNLWDNLTLTGTTDTDVTTDERVLRVTSVSSVPGMEMVTLGMACKSVTASGQLVRVWGKVKEKTSSYLTLDDGSGVTVKVETDGLTTPITVTANVGDYVSASGPAGCMAGGVTVVRVRSAGDIKTY